MNNKILLTIIAIALTVQFLNAQSNSVYKHNADSRDEKGIRIMFYNVENLFDTKDDTLKNDEQFLPDGIKHWNDYKYWDKQKKISKVITAVGGWEAPAIVGLAEIENLRVLKNLIYNTTLKSYNYQIIHFESPDKRGIDVAMLFRPDKLKLIHKEAVPVIYESGRPTRDILFAQFEMLTGDTINVFVNHWPSRWGGQMKTEPKRMIAAKTLKSKTDSLLLANNCSNIIAMGDLNDDPENKSIKEVLLENGNSQMQNISADLGTLFYKGNLGGKWNTFDQIIVSDALFNYCGGLKLGSDSMYVFKEKFLLEENSSGGYKPYRTYLGMKYHGGFSDHLPVFVDVFIKD